MSTQELEKRVAALEQQVAELTAKLYEDQEAEKILIDGLRKVRKLAKLPNANNQ
jgi:hypothetical protein